MKLQSMLMAVRYLSIRGRHAVTGFILTDTAVR